MPILTVRHKTVYRYAVPVAFGEHRLMLRPRDSHDLRLLETSLEIRPRATIRWFHDVFGNSVAVASFGERAMELVFDSWFRAEHFARDERDIVVAPGAQCYPFFYDPGETTDLAPALMRAGPDPGEQIAAWARGFVGPGRPPGVIDLLSEITRAIKAQFSYVRRDAMGTQPAATTLASRSGNCRDFALFMMEAVRSLGFAAQFVSGYLHDESAWGWPAAWTGGAATHAWVQVYVPGGGWIEFDPTNGLVGGAHLIRVAVVRDPAQAIPVSGTYEGRPGDFLGLSVDVQVAADRTM